MDPAPGERGAVCFAKNKIAMLLEYNARATDSADTKNLLQSQRLMTPCRNKLTHSQHTSSRRNQHFHMHTQDANRVNVVDSVIAEQPLFKKSRADFSSVA